MVQNSPNPLISVIVTVYNMEACLAACVESVLAQSYPCFELLLIDDGSADNSAAMCDAWAAADGRVRVIHQQNMGLSGARNTGVAEAKGEYLTFIDADDIVMPAYLEVLLHLCRRYDVSLAACNHTIVRGSHRQARFAAGEADRVLSAKEALENVLYQQLPDVSCWGKLYYRDLIVAMAYPTGKIYEDTHAFAPIMLKAGKIAFTPQPLYDYIMRGDSLSHGAFSPVRYQYIEAVDHMTGAIENAYPELKGGCICRHAFALLSVRRYFVDCTPELRPQRNRLEKEIRKYTPRLLLDRRVPMRDKIGAAALLLGSRMYDRLWKFYEARRSAKGKESVDSHGKR